MEISERYFPLSNSSLPEFLEDVPEVDSLLGSDRSRWIAREVGDGNLNARKLVLDASSFGHINLVTAAARAIQDNQ